MQKALKLLHRQKLPFRWSENISSQKRVLNFDLSSARTNALEVKGEDFQVQGLSENELWVSLFKRKPCYVVRLSQLCWLVAASEEAVSGAQRCWLLGQIVVNSITRNAAFLGSSLV